MSFSSPTVGVVTVTYNSGRFLDEYLLALQRQTQPATSIILVDSGSSDTQYLSLAENSPMPVTVLREANVGFAAGSNLGWQAVRSLDYVLFLNPDAFPAADFLEKATALLAANPDIGMVTPTLLRFDLETRQPQNVVDTTGVVRNGMGLLIERDGGQPLSVLTKYKGPNDVPWVCAAAVLARSEALESVLEPDGSGQAQLFDESFFMYKEDTDLAWRVRRAGWRLVHDPRLLGYHCRGWQSRKSMPRRLRLMTARNEIRMCIKNRSPFLIVAAAKYCAVLLLDY